MSTVIIIAGVSSVCLPHGEVGDWLGLSGMGVGESFQGYRTISGQTPCITLLRPSAETGGGGPSGNTKQTSPDGNECPSGFTADLGISAEELLLQTRHGLAV